MKYFHQLNRSLTRNQKKTFSFLTVLTFISMMLEIVTLNFLLILLSYMTNSSSLTDSKIFIYLKDLNFDYDLNLIVLVVFICSFFLKSFFNIFISYIQQRFINVTRADLNHIFFNNSSF